MTCLGRVLGRRQVDRRRYQARADLHLASIDGSPFAVSVVSGLFFAPCAVGFVFSLSKRTLGSALPGSGGPEGGFCRRYRLEQ